MMRYLEQLRRAVGDGPVTPEQVEAVVGPGAVVELRRWYFPRWRENRIQEADEMLRASRTVKVDDEFEKRVVEALAPPGLLVRVQVNVGDASTDAAVTTGVH